MYDLKTLNYAVVLVCSCHFDQQWQSILFILLLAQEFECFSNYDMDKSSVK